MRIVAFKGPENEDLYFSVEKLRPGQLGIIVDELDALSVIVRWWHNVPPRAHMRSELIEVSDV